MGKIGQWFRKRMYGVFRGVNLLSTCIGAGLALLSLIAVRSLTGAPGSSFLLAVGGLKLPPLWFWTAFRWLSAILLGGAVGAALSKDGWGARTCRYRGALFACVSFFFSLLAYAFLFGAAAYLAAFFFSLLSLTALLWTFASFLGGSGFSAFLTVLPLIFGIFDTIQMGKILFTV